MLQGFIRGYGPVDSQSVCDVAVFLGLYLFLWASILTEEAAPCRVENVYQFAGELIIMGTEKDIHRIHGTFLGRLLRS
jgi:Uma2 family endonuclease